MSSQFGLSSQGNLEVGIRVLAVLGCMSAIKTASFFLIFVKERALPLRSRRLESPRRREMAIEIKNRLPVAILVSGNGGLSSALAIGMACMALPKSLYFGH
jgi:hypothetical protein